MISRTKFIIFHALLVLFLMTCVALGGLFLIIKAHEQGEVFGVMIMITISFLFEVALLVALYNGFTIKCYYDYCVTVQKRRIRTDELISKINKIKEDESLQKLK